MAKTLINGSHAHYLYNFRSPLVQDMLDRGHEVHVSSPGLTGRFADHFRAMGAVPHEIVLERTKVSFLSDLRYLISVKRLIDREAIDFVLNYTIKPNIWGSLASKWAGARSASMVTGLGFAFIDREGVSRKVTQKVAQGLYRLATNANSHGVFQNLDDRDDFIRAGCLGDASKVILTNGSGVDMDFYAPVALPDRPVFLTVGRLLHSKGLAELAEAATAVRRALPDARILLAGSLDTGPDAASQAELDAWTRQGMEYIGYLDDVRGAIAQASVFVLPSWREGTPRTVLEAMSMGRPTITTDVPGCRETTVHADNGYLVPVRDPAALAQAMIALGRDPDLRAQMGQRSREIVEGKFDVVKVNAALLDRLGL